MLEKFTFLILSTLFAVAKTSFFIVVSVTARVEVSIDADSLNNDTLRAEAAASILADVSV